jgi:hypothetical protein
MNCRFCNNDLSHVFIDLVNSPLANSFLSLEELSTPETFYPLKLYVCENCFLVQIDEYRESEKIFDDNYIYFSSFSKSWLEHAKNYVAMITERLNLQKDSFVIEIASNDGYLLQYFQERKIPCLGIEPSSNTAMAAREKGIEVVSNFFSTSLAQELVNKGTGADLIIGNNVLAHVPDINDFVEGISIILAKSGTATLEFPHLLRLVSQNQFDSIYHEHFSYLSFGTVQEIFQAHSLTLYDVEELPTHGGSLRIYAKHTDNNSIQVTSRVRALIQKEIEAGMDAMDFYINFQNNANKVKYGLLSFLLQQKYDGKTVAAYGAAAKGNTLLNYCGIKSDLISFVVDASPHKQDKFLPGSHIPVVKEDVIKEQRPDYILILPWNLKDEISTQLEYIRKWNGQFIIPVPEIHVF